MKDSLSAQRSIIANDAAFAARPPPAIPDHQLQRCVGRGSYGEVWLARNVMGTPRAVKIIYREQFQDDRPFEREFAGIQKFEPLSRSHPSQLQILHIGRHEGGRYFYYVMELADDLQTGQEIDPNSYSPKTLRRELLHRGRLSFQEALDLSLDLVAALEHLHQHDLIHRDIKPSNIISVNGIWKLADIGLVARADETLTFVGTEGFLPPEGPGSAQADIYSLGKVIYEASTGKDRQRFPDPPTALREFPDREDLLELNEIVLKACEADSRKRYQSAREMHRELLLLQGGKSLRRARVLERRLALAIRVGLLTSLLGVCAVAGYFYQQRQTRRAERARVEVEKANVGLARAISRLQMQKTEGLMNQQDPAAALTYLAAVLRQNPSNDMAAERLLSILSHRSFALPAASRIMPADLKPGGEVPIAQFSRDGRRVVTVTIANAVQVWDAQTAKPLTPPFGHSEHIESVQFSSDNQWLITASWDGTARIWNSFTGTATGPPLEHSARVVRAEFSPDGRRIVTAGWSGSVRLWSATTYAPIVEIFRHGDRVVAAEFSRDGTKLLTASWDGTARVFDGGTFQPVSETFSHPGRVLFAHFSPDVKTVLTGADDNRVRLWSTRDGKLLATLPHHSHLRSAHFSPNGDRLISVSDDSAARVWDISTDKPVFELKHKAWVNSAAFSRDGKRIATTSHDLTARVWDAATGQAEVEPIKHPIAVTYARFNSDGNRLATGSFRDWSVRLWDVRPGNIRPITLEHAGYVPFAEFSPDDQKVVTASWDNTARVWDALTGRPLTAPLKHDGPVISAYFSRDGEKVVTASEDRTARVWSALTGALISPPLVHNDAVTSAQFSPEGQRVITASADRSARIWEAKTGRLLTEPLRHSNILQTAEFSPSGQWIVTASSDQTARIWDGFTGQPVTDPLLHPRQVSSARFSPDSTKVVTACYDQHGRVWDARTGKLLLKTPRHSIYYPASSAEFSRDGRWIITVGGETTRIWDADNGLAVSQPFRYEQLIASAQFGPSTKRLLIAGADAATRVWNILTMEPVSEALLHGTFPKGGYDAEEGWQTIDRSRENYTRVWDRMSGQPVPMSLFWKAGRPSAQFSSDGHRILTAFGDMTAKIWDIPPAPVPVPPWLPELAEGVAGMRVDEDGLIRSAHAERLLELKSTISASGEDSVYTRWAQWFFADRDTRPRAPHLYEKTKQTGR